MRKQIALIRLKENITLVAQLREKVAALESREPLLVELRKTVEQQFAVTELLKTRLEASLAIVAAVRRCVSSGEKEQI